MGLDWSQPFKLAFEIGMFALGWLLVVIIVAFFALLTFAIVQATVKTIRGRNSKSATTKRSGIITFDKK